MVAIISGIVLWAAPRFRRQDAAFARAQRPALPRTAAQAPDRSEATLITQFCKDIADAAAENMDGAACLYGLL